MPWRPMMKPAVGKSGPGMRAITPSSRSSGVRSWLSSRKVMPSTTSPRLWGGMFVAMPTAMPAEPFTRRFGSTVGSTIGSLELSS